MDPEPAPETAAELEAFRRRWREEVQSRNRQTHEAVEPDRPKQQQQQQQSQSQSQQQRRRSVLHPPTAVAGPSAPNKPEVDYEDEVAPKSYHDLPNREEALRLGDKGQERERAKHFEQPKSALEHYEKAVEKETYGQLGDSLKHYRTAFKLDDGVHEHYKKKHFPPSSFPPKQKPPPAGTSSSTTTKPPAQSSLPTSLQQLVQDFSGLKIEPAPPATDLSPQQPCPLAEIPEEILSHILLSLAVIDVASFARTAQVCKRLAHLVLSEESVWRRVTLGDECGFGAMHYDFATDIEGNPLPASLGDAERQLGTAEDDAAELASRASSLTNTHSPAFHALTAHLLRTHYATSWREMFRSRPRLRFNGCYISTVNYLRAGGASLADTTTSWSVAPVHVVTYFRYLRFFRDGSCLSLLTTAEPLDVVHHLTKANVRARPPPNTPGHVMKDALKGRWRLSGPEGRKTSGASGGEGGEAQLPAQGQAEEEADEEPGPALLEGEGDVHIETQGVVPRYVYVLKLGVRHAGKHGRSNKLAWKGFWSYNRLSDDWGEFALRNDKAFYWSRVRSYGDGWE